MGPFDWNGNGSHDAFDSFMDMKVMGDSDSSDSDSSFDDFDSDFDSDSDEILDDDTPIITHHSYSGYPTYSSNKKANSGMSFQDELKQSIRTPEVVKKENTERMNNAMRYDAEHTLREIKSSLLYKAKNAEYTTENGVTSLTCFCQMPHRFMRSRREDNGDQLRQNQQTFFLFRDPNLVYMTWNNYEIEPKYSSEYYQYIAALKELASKENIIIESVVYNGREKKYVAFPSRVRNDYSYGWTLCVKATTVISGNANNIPSKNVSQPTTVGTTSTQSKTQTNTEQKQPDSNGTTIVKSILCVGICLAGFAIAMAAEGGLIGAAALIGAAFLGYKIMTLK